MHGRLAAVAGQVQRPAAQDAEERLRQKGQHRGQLLCGRARLRGQRRAGNSLILDAGACRQLTFSLTPFLNFSHHITCRIVRILLIFHNVNGA